MADIFGYSEVIDRYREKADLQIEILKVELEQKKRAMMPSPTAPSAPMQHVVVQQMQPTPPQAAPPGYY